MKKSTLEVVRESIAGGHEVLEEIETILGTDQVTNDAPGYTRYTETRGAIAALEKVEALLEADARLAAGICQNTLQIGKEG